ncbi:MAG: hypothetical protein NXI24_16195 [bacterium]|nr:hypothetical protein [bacterium]
MGGGRNILYILVVLLIFALVSQAIISVKLLELRVQVSHDRLFNYELSSRVLKARFRQMVASQNQSRNDSFKNEIKRNLLESTIMNEVNPQALESGALETVGMAVINSVRLLSLKPLLELRENQETLTRIKYAFFMERNRRYDVAVERYAELEDRLGQSGEMAGFVSLHHGFCLAITGETEPAIAKLESTRDTFPGTHYAETAILLINILLEGERRREIIEGEGLSDLERARALFREALWSDALDLFQKIGENNLAPYDRYRLNRSLEETGQIKPAIQGYIGIVGARRDPAAVRDANRRLLLLGTFNGAGARVREYAETNAAELGDDTALVEIKEAAEELRSSVVIDEIKEAAESGEDTGLEDLAQQLEENIVLDAPLQQMARPLIPGPGQPPGGNAREVYRIPDLSSLALALPEPVQIDDSGRLMVEFRDGRRIRARSVVFLKTELEIEGDFPSRVPVTVVRSVGLFDDRGQPVAADPAGDSSGRIQLVPGDPGAARLTAWRIEVDAAAGVLLIYASGQAQAQRIEMQEIQKLESP